MAIALIGKWVTTITVQRPVVVRSAMGDARDHIWEPVVSGLPASIQPASARIVEAYARRQMYVDVSIYVDQNPGIGEGYRVLADGTLYDVVGATDRAGLSRLWRIDARVVAVGEVP